MKYSIDIFDSYLLLFWVLTFSSFAAGHPVENDGRQSFLGTSSGANNETTIINFDDISLQTSPNRSLTSYNMFEFMNFEIINATAAAEAKIILPVDVDCAVSPPNALRSVMHEHKMPSLIKSNATALAAANSSEFFDFKSLDVKPMGFIRRGAMMSILAWEIHGRKPVNVYTVYIIFLRDENRAPLHIDFDRIFRNRGWGKRVNWIEVEMETREHGPWSFAIDNLGVTFYPVDGDDHKSRIPREEENGEKTHTLYVF